MPLFRGSWRLVNTFGAGESPLTTEVVVEGPSRDRRRRGWPTMSGIDRRNLPRTSRTTWSIARGACAMTRLNDFNSIGDQISNKWTTAAPATATYERVRPTCCRHLGDGDVILLPVLPLRCLLPVHWRCKIDRPEIADICGNFGRCRSTSGFLIDER